MNRVRISISSKRQFTIPKMFFEALGFNTEADCIMCGNELIIRPVQANGGGTFAEQILSELIAEGLSGEELLEEFKIRQKKIRPAVEALLAEADAVARGEGEFATYNDIFGPEEQK